MAGPWLVVWSALMGRVAAQRGHPSIAGWLLAPWLGVFTPLVFLGGGHEDCNEREVSEAS